MGKGHSNEYAEDINFSKSPPFQCLTVGLMLRVPSVEGLWWDLANVAQDAQCNHSPNVQIKMLEQWDLLNVCHEELKRWGFSLTRQATDALMP